MENKQADIYIDTIGRVLRENGIWALVEGMNELKDGILKFTIAVFPVNEIIRTGKGELPTQTLVRTRLKGEKDSKYHLYKISKEELDKGEFVERLGGEER